MYMRRRYSDIPAKEAQHMLQHANPPADPLQGYSVPSHKSSRRLRISSQKQGMHATEKEIGGHEPWRNGQKFMDPIRCCSLAIHYTQAAFCNNSLMQAK
ncbi:hypothetical protein CDAR_182381 [Caerostris darwini]|uniref:Uncharacterized protein n=1 Tax=Caerostris darwini TaxID=1538125 RepID=A0AAV4U5W4_9ARAC|nr:hypothetical protein CDAR_182381 [Caerostris darwini]